MRAVQGEWLGKAAAVRIFARRIEARHASGLGAAAHLDYDLPKVTHFRAELELAGKIPRGQAA